MPDISNELKLGITLQGVEPPDVFQQQVRDLESVGYSHLWVTDSSLHARYVYSYLTLAALNSERLMVGTGVTHPFTRHPAITVNAIATIDEISGGRAMLGIGAGDRPTGELGFSPARLKMMREMVTLARRLMAGEKINYANSAFKLVDAKIHYKHRDHVPIYMACSGPRMLALAGELADGIIVQVGVSPEAIKYAIQCIAEGAERGGRSLDEIELWIMACGAISEDREQARNSSRTMAAWFAQTVPLYCELANIDPKIVKGIQTAYSGGEFHLAKDAARLVPDEMVELFTVGGTPDEARDRITRLADLDFTGINFMPIGPERTQSFKLFADCIRGLQTRG